MDIETARAAVAAGDAKYGRVFQELCDWQYRAFERLRDDGAISKKGFDRMVAVPHGRIVVDGARGGPWIGARTLTDGEVIDSGAVACFVFHESINTQPLMMGIVFYPFVSPGVSDILAAFRTDLRQNLGWFGRLLCATPFGRYIHPRDYVGLAALTAVLEPDTGNRYVR